MPGRVEGAGYKVAYPIRNHQLQIERFTEALYESMVRMLLREQAQFLQTEVSEELRQKLQRQLGASEQQRGRWMGPKERYYSSEGATETDTAELAPWDDCCASLWIEPGCRDSGYRISFTADAPAPGSQC